MTQQFRVESTTLRDKINSLLPSQARGSIDVDLTGQTTIVPIVDLTETAEGSSLRQDLQTSLSLGSVTSHSVTNTTTTIINTPGYWRLFGGITILANTSNAGGSRFTLTDGTTSKVIKDFKLSASSAQGQQTISYDFIVKLEAGESLTITADTTSSTNRGCSRQLATVDGTLVNP
jgi:hypothetical protein